MPGNQGPPAANPPTDVQPGPVPRCKRARLECVKRLERHLTREWKRYDATCDHRAVVYYSYLEITKGLRRDLAGPRPGIVRHRRWMTYLITTFSNRFREAFADYAAGRPVPDGWRIAFETYDEGDANAGQDVLLFSSVHVQHDLAFAYEEMGTATRVGRVAQARPRRRQRDQPRGLRPDPGLHRRPLRPELRGDRRRPVAARRDRDPGAGRELARERLALRRAPARREDRGRARRGRRRDPGERARLGRDDLLRRHAGNPRAARRLLRREPRVRLRRAGAVDWRTDDFDGQGS